MRDKKGGIKYNKVGYRSVISQNEIKCVLRYSIYFRWLVHSQEYRVIVTNMVFRFCLRRGWGECNIINLFGKDWGGWGVGVGTYFLGGIISNIYNGNKFVKRDQAFPLCYLLCFTSHHHLLPLYSGVIGISD